MGVPHVHTNSRNNGLGQWRERLDIYSRGYFMIYVRINHQHYLGWSKGHVAGPANISWQYTSFSIILPFNKTWNACFMGKWICLSIYIYLYLSISIYIYLYLSISIYIYLYLSIYLSIYLYTRQYNYNYTYTNIFIWYIYIYKYYITNTRSVLLGWCHRLHLQSSVGQLRSDLAPPVGWTLPQSGQHQKSSGTLARPLSAVLGRRFGNLWMFWDCKLEHGANLQFRHKVLDETKNPKDYSSKLQHFQVISGEHSYKNNRKRTQWQRGPSNWSCRWERCCRSCCIHCLREERPLERSCHRWCRRNLRGCQWIHSLPCYQKWRVNH